jgi:hypothetical protein
MGGKQSSCGDTFQTQRDKQLDQREPVLGVFIDYRQFPVSGIINIINSSM